MIHRPSELSWSTQRKAENHARTRHRSSVRADLVLVQAVYGRLLRGRSAAVYPDVTADEVRIDVLPRSLVRRYEPTGSLVSDLVFSGRIIRTVFLRPVGRGIRDLFFETRLELSCGSIASGRSGGE